MCGCHRGRHRLKKLLWRGCSPTWLQTPQADGVEILQVNEGTQAEQHAELRAGLTLKKVGETATDTLEYQEVITLLKESPRPVVLTFQE